MRGSNDLQPLLPLLVSTSAGSSPIGLNLGNHLLVLSKSGLKLPPFRHSDCHIMPLCPQLLTFLQAVKHALPGPTQHA
jgi:hypothetical protein